MNFQSWQGVDDSKFGYGSMLAGFKSVIPKTVTLNDDASVLVYMNTPDGARGFLSGQHRACFTMWETDQLPSNFLRWLPKYDQLIVPCQHNLELFSQHHSDVRMVPLGVDNKFWSGYTEPDGTFKFLAGGSLWFRKGLDVVVKAFQRLDLPDAELHIKAAPHAGDTPNVKHPRIVMHRKWMDEEAQREWFRQGHVFIAASRGEGFGLMPLQAISLGIPTIVSDTTGQEQFSHLATGVVTTTRSPAFTIGNWDEPNLDELCEQMLDHYRNWNVHQAQAVFNAKSSSAWSWRKATKALIDAVPVGTLLEEPSWEPVVVNVPIKVKKKMSCDIGRTHYDFLPGVEYQVPEGVLQVLSDAKVLEI